MALPLLPIAGAGLSFIGDIFGNSQAKKNAKVQAKMAYNNFNIAVNGLKETAEEINREVGMELTNVKFQELQAVGAMANAITEREITGNTAKRLADNVNIKGMSYSNQIKQQAEANMVKIQKEMFSEKNRYEATVMQIAVQQANATKSGLEMLIGAGTAYYGFGGTDTFGQGTEKTGEITTTIAGRLEPKMVIG